MQVAKHALIDKSFVLLFIHLKPLQALNLIHLNK